MKLIIDIDENYYELLKNSTIKPDWDTMWRGKEKDKEIMFATVGLIECLKNGIIVSNEGDLISREALKKDFGSRLADCDEWIEKAKDKETRIKASWVKSFIIEVIMTIDNAPTVEPEVYMNGKDYNLYLEGYKQGKKDFERPQDDLIKAFELLKAHCKNRECNKDCVFYRELTVGDNTEQFCGLCEIVTSDDKENNND